MAENKTYAEKLKDPRWQKKRLEILKRDKWKCTFCKDTKETLHVHHLKYTPADPHDEPNENLITACETCHKVLEWGKSAKIHPYHIEKGAQRLFAFYKNTIVLFDKNPFGALAGIDPDKLLSLHKTYKKYVKNG